MPNLRQKWISCITLNIRTRRGQKGNIINERQLVLFICNSKQDLTLKNVHYRSRLEIAVLMHISSCIIHQNQRLRIKASNNFDVPYFFLSDYKSPRINVKGACWYVHQWQINPLYVVLDYMIQCIRAPCSPLAGLQRPYRCFSHWRNASDHPFNPQERTRVLTLSLCMSRNWVQPSISKLTVTQP